MGHIKKKQIRLQVQRAGFNYDRICCTKAKGCNDLEYNQNY